MPKIGVHELTDATSEVIRTVREEQAEYIVTYWGEPVAVILPMDDVRRRILETRILVEARAHTDYWSALDALAAEIDDAWMQDQGAIEILDKQWREL
ncbi:MAG: type II toxin-antitoxin system prevent-host-death family antitoxin [Chloroflexota bacterium]|nr:type II toxin-antitoxin system prevent-host-death family antitoxin [Chloroflexota bacterium]